MKEMHVFGVTPKERKFIADLIGENEERLRKSAASILKNKNEDNLDECLQELYVLAYENIEKLLLHPCPEGWLFKTISNIAHDMKRDIDKNMTYLISYEDIEDKLSEESFENELIERMRAKEIDIQAEKEKILSQLSSRELDLYKLKFVENRDYTYIAKKYNTSPGCIRAWISQLKKRVIKIIKKI